MGGKTRKYPLSFCKKGCFTAHKSPYYPCCTQQQRAALHPEFPSFSVFVSNSLFLPLLKLEHMTSTPTLSHVNYQSPHPGVRSHPRKTNQSNQKALLLECGFVTPTLDPPSLQQVLKICGGQFSLV